MRSNHPTVSALPDPSNKKTKSFGATDSVKTPQTSNSTASLGLSARLGDGLGSEVGNAEGDGVGAEDAGDDEGDTVGDGVGEELVGDVLGDGVGFDMKGDIVGVEVGSSVVVGCGSSLRSSSSRGSGGGRMGALGRTG